MFEKRSYEQYMADFVHYVQYARRHYCAVNIVRKQSAMVLDKIMQKNTNMLQEYLTLMLQTYRGALLDICLLYDCCKACLFTL